MTDNGDKPGNGWELNTHDGRVADGRFYLLDPNKPLNIQAALQSAELTELEISGKAITFSITLVSGDGAYHDTLTITFSGPLKGGIGEAINAKIQSLDPDSSLQNLVFVRRR